MNAAEETLASARERGYRIWLDGDRVRFAAPPTEDASAIVEALRAERAAILALLRAEALVPIDRAARLPLSPAETRLWFFDQLARGTPTYNLPCPLRLRGRLNLDALERSVTAVVRRHEALRTRYVSEGGVPARVIDPPRQVAVAVESSSGSVERWVHVAAQRSFDLAKGPLFEARVLRVADEDHVLLLATHHIVVDDVSLRIVLDEIAALYADPRAPLAALPLQYADVAAWQSRLAATTASRRKLQRWTERLTETPVLELPTDHPRRSEERFPAEVLAFTVERSLVEKARASVPNTTLFMTLLTAFAVVLGRWSGAPRFAIGFPSAGRAREELDRVVGLLVDTLVVPIDLEGGPTGRELLERVRRATLDASAHDVPFEELARALNPTRELGRSPIFQVMLTLLDGEDGVAAAFARSGLEATSVPVRLDTAKFDLALDLVNRADGTLHATLEYRADLFEADTVRRVATHFEAILRGLAGDPERDVFTLPMLDETELLQCARWSAPLVEPIAGPSCIHELVAVAAARRPQAVAVAGAEGTLTYRELEERSDRLAHVLVREGAGAETIVALCLERSFDLVVALLAVLKAGASYLPLDPTYPTERLAVMIDDARPILVLGHAATEAKARAIGARAFLAVDALDLMPERGRLPRVSSRDRAYVIYTSGSTGSPKGVEVEHGSLVNFTHAMIRAWAMTENDRVLQFTTINWDTSCEEIWPCLASGGRLVLRTEEMVEPHALLDACEREGLTVLDFSTAYFPEFVRAIGERRRVPPSLRLVQFGGEQASIDAIAAWQKYVGPEVRLVHGYGVTEATAMTTTCDLARQEIALGEGVAPIGTPLLNMRAYVLDASLAPVPAGVVGELTIGGAGVARGYLGDPAGTALKFVPDPFVGGRMYRTGDLARFRRDGSLELLGRRDRQVKIRGIRVETGDVETALRRHPGVREATVVLLRDRLVAYVVAPGVDTLAILATARGALPEYMVPKHVVALDALPMLPSGKIDRRALPAPAEPAARVLPRDAEERALAAIWCELLGLAAVGVHGNFFDLGGHSLLVLRLLARVRTAFGVELSIRDVFDAPTIAELRKRIVAGNEHALPPLEVRPHAPLRALSESQRGLWSACRPGTALWKNGFTTRIRGPLDVDALGEAVVELQHRHELLGVVYDRIGEVPAFRLVAPLPLAIVDVTSEAELQEQLRALEERPIGYAPGERVSTLHLFRLSASDHVLALASHNLVVGGSSVEKAQADLFAIYTALVEGRTLPPGPTVQYADWVDWGARFAATDRHRSALAYWRTQLATAEPLRLPWDPTDEANLFVAGAPVRLGPVVELARRLSATSAATLLALYAAFLHRVTGGQRSLCILQLFESRPPFPGLDDVIGHFLVQLPIVLRIGDDETFASLTAQAMNTLAAAYAHGTVGAPAIYGTDAVYDHPLVAALLNFGDEETPPPGPPGLTLEAVAVRGVRPTRRMKLAWVVSEADAAFDSVLVGAESALRPDTTRRLACELAEVAARVLAEPALRIDRLGVSAQ